MKMPMRLRDRMTLRYTGLTFLAVIVFSGVLYLSVQHIMEQMLEQNAQLSLRQVIAQIEADDGTVVFENEVPVSSDSMFFITEENGSELASFGADITLFDAIPIAPGLARHVQGASKDWLILDSDVITVANADFRVRVALSSEYNNRILGALQFLFLIGLPIMLLMAWLGGRLIAEKSLLPIRQIITGANRIGEGDLSARIPQTKVRDELGELTETLNRMLQNVETTFQREKRFASDASHELRTPIAVMQAYTESLRAQDSTTPEQRTELDTILSECYRMQKIISQLLTITRGEEGRYPILMERVDLREIIRSVQDTIAEKVAQKDIRMSVDLQGCMTLDVDQTLITEMFLNLLENAVKYGKQDGNIAVSAIRSDKEMTIQVRDDGIGIPEDALSHIFERFFRVDAARDRIGTGLGLSIVEWIVKDHHSTIHVHSQLRMGTNFCINLPCKIQTACV